MLEQTKTFKKRLSHYFKSYGGWGAIFRSPLFILAVAITAISYKNWIEANWVDQSISLVPNLLGFSLGTYAILFSLLTNRLKQALRAKKNDSNISYLDEINATFFHFIFIQVLALMWAFLFSGSALFDLVQLLSVRIPLSLQAFEALYLIGSFVGHLLLIYSILLILAAALAVYRLARIIDPNEK